MDFITDKKLPTGNNLYTVIAVQTKDSVDYYTAIYGIGGEEDKTFVLANDDVGQVFTIDQIKGYFVFEEL